MTNTNNSLIDTWEKYKKWVSGLVDSKKEYYYRGQADSGWKLETTFHREAASSSFTMDDYLTRILPEVHYHVSAIQNEIIDSNNPNEFGAFLALLRHHGFPTPLLDWTLSPYIGAYFAFKEINDRSPQCDHVKIFIFDHVAWLSSFEQPMDLREKKQYVTVIRPYAKHNERIIHQRGAYTVTNVPDMAAYILKRGRDVNKSFLFEVVLPVSERTKVMRELHLMGITEMSLFPGLDGVCRTMKEQFFSKDIVGLSPQQIKELLNNLSKTTTQSTTSLLDQFNVLGKK